MKGIQSIILRSFCEFCGLCGRIKNRSAQERNSNNYPRSFREIREISGRIKNVLHTKGIQRIIRVHSARSASSAGEYKNVLHTKGIQRIIRVHSASSAKSAGEYKNVLHTKGIQSIILRSFCEICEICGRIKKTSCTRKEFKALSAIILRVLWEIRTAGFTENKNSAGSAPTRFY